MKEKKEEKERKKRVIYSEGTSATRRDKYAVYHMRVQCIGIFRKWAKL